jgi:DNA polymerase III sliding clamp (beta) subunit (PCNA family)
MLTSTAENYPNDRKDYEPMGVLPDGNIFRRMVSDTSYASDSSGQSPELGAVYYRVEDQELSIMATDRRRCAVATTTLDESADTPMSWFLVPNTTSAIISSTITTDAPLILGRSGKMLVLDNGHVWLSCRCLEGEWYYDAIQAHLMDMEGCDTVVVDRPELAQALDRSEIFGDSDAPIADLIFGGNEIEVRTDETALTGATSDLIPTRSSCPPITKKVRTNAVRDALAHANGDVVEITLSSEKQAFMIERHDDGTDVAYSNQCFMVPQVVSKAGVNA